MAKRPKPRAPDRRSPTAAARPKLTARLVELCRERFEAGESAALLNAVDLCARSGLPVPMWAAQAFCDRFIDWVMYRAPTLDAAFGVTRPARAKIGALARREAKRAHVVSQVVDLHLAGVPLDERLFAQVGEALRLSGGTVKSIFYDDASQPLRKILVRRAGGPGKF